MLDDEFQISGREMFEFNPDLVGEDDDEAAEGVIERERDSDDEVKYRESGLNGHIYTLLHACLIDFFNGV